MEQFFQTLTQYMELIYPYIVAFLPSLTAMATCVITVVRICAAFKDLRKDVNDKTDLKEARAEMKQIIMEDRALKRRLDKLIEIEGKVKQYDTNEKI